MTRQAVIVGCGFTGARAAALLLARGWRVTATARTPRGIGGLERLGARVVSFDASLQAAPDASADGASVLLSVPTLRRNGALDDPTRRIVSGLRGVPSHLTYLSTTGVYGAIARVDAATGAAPASERQRLRALAEDAVRSCPCPSLVLRPAAIYGPGRGVHAAMRAGRFRLSRGRDRFVSRIHVSDLAAIVAAAMDRGLEGTYPVADRRPASSREVAEYCCELLGMAMPPAVPDAQLSATRRSDRRVDGSGVLGALGLGLQYPSYREGIPASIAEEADD